MPPAGFEPANRESEDPRIKPLGHRDDLLWIPLTKVYVDLSKFLA